MNICFFENENVLLKSNYRTNGEAFHTQSTVVRVHNISRALQGQGYTCSVVGVHTDFKEVKESINAANAVVFHRIQGSKTTLIDYRYLRALSHARSKGKKIFFDVDDAIHVTFPLAAEAIAKLATGVFAGSHSLADHYKRFSDHVFLVPSSVDTSAIKHNPRPHGNLVLGWQGSALGHLANLLDIAPVLSELARGYDLTFKVLGTVGNMEVQRKLRESYTGITLDFGPETWFNINELPQHMADVDIGVYPLLDNVWNRSKCSMKLLEYMALSLPSVCSAVGENLHIIQTGTDGYLAPNHRSWVNSLRDLLDDDKLRQRIGANAREKVVSSYDLKIIASQISKVLELYA